MRTIASITRSLCWFFAVLLLLCQAAHVCLAEEKQRGTSKRQTINTDELRFASEPLQVFFDRFDAAARQTAGERWHHRPYMKRPTASSADAHWCLYTSPGGECRCHRLQHAVNRHIRIGVKLDANDHRLVKELYGHAKYLPPGDGWGATVHFRFTGKSRRFSVELCSDDLSEAVNKIHVPHAYYRTSKVFYPFEYRIRTHDRTRPPLTDAGVPQLLSSPEAFRDRLLSEVDQLEVHVLAELGSGKAIDAIMDYSPPPGTRGRPWKYSEANHTNAFGEVTVRLPKPEHIEAIKKQALEEFQTRRTLIRNHYHEMHASTLQAFPLQECLRIKTMDD